MERDYKRYFKNFLLIFLIIVCFFLVFRLWSVGNYFGTGLAESFSNVVKVIREPFENLFGSDDEGSLQNLKFVLSPKRIVASYDEKRSIMKSDDEDFFGFYEEVVETLRDIEAGKIKIVSVENVSENDYYAALKGKSILVDYDNKYDYNLLTVVTDVVGESKLMSSSAVVREIILSLSDNVLNYTTLYMMDYTDGKVYKFMLDMNKDDLEKLVQNRLSKSSSPDTYFYSFELNFHLEQNEDGTPARVVFNPMTSVALVPEERQGIVSWRYGTEGEELKNEAELLKLFDINVMSAGKYTDIDGSRNFVEKNATLKIGSNGVIEYVSAEGGKGIKLSEINDNQSFDIGLATIEASEFVRDILSLLPQSENDQLRISGDLVESSSIGAYTICYDYYIGGLPVFQIDEQSNVITNSVICMVENGYLKYYKHYLRNYDYTEEKKIQETMITAADALVGRMAPNSGVVRIGKAYECFVDTGSGEPEADWAFKIEGLDGLYR